MPTPKTNTPAKKKADAAKKAEAAKAKAAKKAEAAKAKAVKKAAADAAKKAKKAAADAAKAAKKKAAADAAKKAKKAEADAAKKAKQKAARKARTELPSDLLLRGKRWADKAVRDVAELELKGSEKRKNAIGRLAKTLGELLDDAKDVVKIAERLIDVAYKAAKRLGQIL